eukprot:scaffold2437_cov395-Prasinococcus_capsulatus_cf.AAC.29
MSMVATPLKINVKTTPAAAQKRTVVSMAGKSGTKKIRARKAPASAKKGSSFGDCMSPSLAKRS